MRECDLNIVELILNNISVENELQEKINSYIETHIKIIYNDLKIVHSPDWLSSNIIQFFAISPSRKMRIALKKPLLCWKFRRI